MSEAWLRRQAGPLLAALAVFLLVYGAELGGFTLSIDEEVASIVDDRARTWLQQGRWGMALATWLLPDFEAIPLLSTVLFGAGLLAATALGLRDFRLERGGAWLFAVVHAGFPLWLHIAEFNTLAAGFGLALAAAAGGGGLLLRPELRARAGGVLLLAFAISVYQTLLLYAALYLLLALHAHWRTQPRTGWAARWRDALPALLGGAAALLAYWLVQKLAMLAAGVQPEYVGGYLQLAQLRADPLGGVLIGARYVASLLLGVHPIYLGWGLGILFLVWPGLWPWREAGDGDAPRRAGGLEAIVLLAALALVALPALPSLGSLPARAYVAWPLLAAWLASRLGPLFARLRPGALALALSYFAIVAGSIGASLWHADRVVHEADAVLARELAAAMRRAAPGTGPLRFTLVGQRGFALPGRLRRAEVFGASFFEHDGGNVYRVAMLMQLQGEQGLEGIWLSHRPELVAAQATMPAWPAEGSVRRVGEVVVVKLGEPTAPQLATP